MKKVYIICFQTAVGASAAQITPLRFIRQAGTHKQSMTMFKSVEIWYSHERRMSEKQALQTARAYAQQWDKNGRPTTGDLRQAIEEGQAALWADKQ